MMYSSCDNPTVYDDMFADMFLDGNAQVSVRELDAGNANSH